MLALFLWLFPSVIERLAGWHSPSNLASPGTIISTFSVSFLITIIPAFSEEFGWRGYLLPRLLKKYPYRKALLVHGLITWTWHMPDIFVMGFEAGGYPWVSVPNGLPVRFILIRFQVCFFSLFLLRMAILAVSNFYIISLY